MLAIYQSRIHAGDEALTFLSLITTRSGLVNRAMAWIFSGPGRSRALYPALRFGRNLTLALLGRSKLGHSQP